MIMGKNAPKLIVWTDKLCIDRGTIDEDHKHLIELCNSFLKNCRQFDSKMQADELISELLDYTSYHFVREEELQKQIGFPDVKQHKDVHANLINDLHEIKYLIRDVDDCDLISVSTKSMRLVRKWLIEHILKHDMPMRAYVKEIHRSTTETSHIYDIALL